MVIFLLCVGYLLVSSVVAGLLIRMNILDPSDRDNLVWAGLLWPLTFTVFLWASLMFVIGGRK